MSFVTYDRRSRQLTITFKSGGKYVYFEVPAQVYEDLLAAPSAGRYFDANIRDRYHFQRIWR